MSCHTFTRVGGLCGLCGLCDDGVCDDGLRVGSEKVTKYGVFDILSMYVIVQIYFWISRAAGRGQNINLGCYGLGRCQKQVFCLLITTLIL